MTMLETNTRNPLENQEAADGRFFDDQNTKGLMEIDMRGIVPLRQEVLALASRLALEKTQPGVLKECLELGFFETTKALQTALRIGEGALRLTMNRTPLAPTKMFKALVNDYAEKHPAEVIIPSDMLTAATVLPYPSTQGDYKPVVDMRIRTSGDKPPKEIQGFKTAEPLGSWFRFDLSQTVIIQMVPISPLAKQS